MSHIFVFNSTMAMFQPLQFQIVTGPIDQVVPVVPQTTTYLVTRGMTDQCLIGGTNIWELKDNVLKVRKNKEPTENIFLSPKNVRYRRKISQKCFLSQEVKDLKKGFRPAVKFLCYAIRPAEMGGTVKHGLLLGILETIFGPFSIRHNWGDLFEKN